MPYAFFRVSLIEHGEARAELNRFLAQHAISRVRERFVDAGSESCWTVERIGLPEPLFMVCRPTVAVRSRPGGRP